MITCSRCGKPTLAGVATCQNCGMPLTNAMSSGSASNMAPGMGTAGQPELPAWLETLRSSERPTISPAGNTGGTNFSAADFVDEGKLPSWMRPERTDGKSPPDSPPVRRPASQPAPDTDGTFLPTRGMAASSLIDEQSLPPWMQEQQAGSQQGVPENISASSLVQPDVLPEWIRTIPPQSPAPAPLDPMQNAQQPNSSQPIAGSDLIDQQSLPQWMSGQGAPMSTSGPGGQASMPASSLLDPHALPSWLSEASAEPGRENATAFSPPQPAQAPNYQVPPSYQTPSGQMLPPSYQAPDGQAPNMNSNLVAASLIDMSALPDWLRPADEQRPNPAPLAPQQGFAESQRQATFGVPPRPEYVRVPSRPRGEMGYHEESEVAANAFASMLGVASAAPYFPGPKDAYGRPQVPVQPQQPQPPQAFNANGMAAPAFPSGQLPGQGGAGMAAGFAGQPPNQGYVPTPAGYPMGNMPGVSQQSPLAANVPGMQSGLSSMNNGQSKSNAKPARRGIFDALRDFFFRS